jgi:predicted dehydrogenase
VITAAEKMDVPFVNTFMGADRAKTQDENWEDALKVWPDIVSFAEDHGRKNSLQWEIDGSAGAAWWDSETPDHLWLGHRDRPNELLLRNPALMGAAGKAAAALPGGHIEGFGDTFGALFRAIYRDVAAGRPGADPPYADFAAGHDEMLVNDAIARSATEGRWVDVERTPTLTEARA